MRDVLIPALVRILRRLRSEERGQSLILVSIAMAIGLGFCAVGIDTASWYQKSHQMQVVADSAALAAANCLASPNVGPTGDRCSSSTDVADAQQVAVNYAQMNGVQISTGNVTVNTTTDTVKVSTSKTSPSFFAQILGIKTTTQSAGSTAAWGANASTACTPALQSAGQCYAIYTANASCGSNDGWVTDETSEQIIGAVHSQGMLNISDGSFTFEGPITYSSGNCTYTQAGNATMSSGGSYYTPTAGDNQASSYWPLDYSKVFPACSTAAGTCITAAAASANGNVVAGAPSYCTYATQSAGYTFGWINNSNMEPLSGNVYCAIGSGTASNPATWNGAITFTNGASAGSSGSPVDVTLIGGYVNATSSTLYLAPQVGNCLMYAVDTDTASGTTGYAIETGNGTYNFTGTMFAPNGTINLNSTSATAAFLEAQNVDTVNLSFQGDGPVVSGSGTSSTSGSDYLTQ
jgi:Putative Flp pilus-assembly TadE/G-like